MTRAERLEEALDKAYVRKWDLGRQAEIYDLEDYAANWPGGVQ